MSNHIRLSKGLDIPLKGNASNQITKTISSDILAVKPSDFRTLNPKLLVKEGDKRPVIINFTDGSMELMMNSAVGSMDETIDTQKEGKDLMIGFNPKFLIDALRVIDDEEVKLFLVNPKAPCFIRDQEENYIYMILPVNFTTVQ